MADAENGSVEVSPYEAAHRAARSQAIERNPLLAGTQHPNSRQTYSITHLDRARYGVCHVVDVDQSGAGRVRIMDDALRFSIPDHGMDRALFKASDGPPRRDDHAGQRDELIAAFAIGYPGGDLEPARCPDQAVTVPVPISQHRVERGVPCPFAGEGRGKVRHVFLKQGPNAGPKAVTLRAGLPIAECRLIVENERFSSGQHTSRTTIASALHRCSVYHSPIF